MLCAIAKKPFYKLKMTEIDKINEELRNYKLFKIQRINTREQQFSELRKELISIKKNEIVSYILATINIFGIIFLIYNIIKVMNDKIFLEVNFEMITANFTVVLILSTYFTISYIITLNNLKKHIKSSEYAVNYFANESEKLKSVYENYVDNYLNQIKKK